MANTAELLAQLLVVASSLTNIFRSLFTCPDSAMSCYNVWATLTTGANGLHEGHQSIATVMHKCAHCF